MIMKCVLLSLFLCVTLVSSLGTLYGLAPGIARLVKINPSTAAVTPVGRHTYPSELTAQQLSSIDIKNKIYYLIAFNSSDRHVYLTGLSLKDGSLLHSVRLPFAPNVLVGVGQTCDVIPATGEVLVSGKDRVRARHHILKVNPVMGNNTLIAEIGDIDVLGAATAYDPDFEMLWLQFGIKSGGINLFAYHIPTKKLMYNISDTLNLETMNFDEVSGTIRGIGLQVFNSHNYTRIMMSLDSKSGKMTVLGKIPDYFIIDAGLGAINENQRTYYSYLQPSSSPNAPFHLVSVNVDTGKVNDSPVADSSTMPWSIAYDPSL